MVHVQYEGLIFSFALGLAYVTLDCVVFTKASLWVFKALSGQSRFSRCSFLDHADNFTSSKFAAIFLLNLFFEIVSDGFWSVSFIYLLYLICIPTSVFSTQYF